MVDPFTKSSSNWLILPSLTISASVIGSSLISDLVVGSKYGSGSFAARTLSTGSETSPLRSLS